MEIALLAKNKLGFLGGTCRRENFDDQIRNQWDHCNALDLSWIINTVSQDLSRGIVFASSAALVWGDLKERFNKVDGGRIFYLHIEIATASQGDSLIAAYFNRLKLLWDEHSALVPYSSCGCDRAQDNLLHLLQQRLFQFLIGLNESYSMIRSQILLMQPLPSVNQAYSMLVQEEGHREFVGGVSPISDS
ncbi:hypothetical protein PVK06_007687 [Gossypium arboreum]|uniref:Retrotransposon gag domain-containing protein n=1 Tax=Gossypium arboreum TaxID=29729 RepID=A0ABR0QIU8_GOSAR|nr:hypothetical protein PVK06_007687 [Gossypium arboreum]